MDDDMKEALALIEEIGDLVDEMPEAGEDFAESVAERAADIGANIMRHDRVTDGQLIALENMRDGLSRWFS